MAIDPREQRGIIIAAMCRLDSKGGQWIVPSQSEPDKKYTVHLDGQEGGHCTCPDCENGFVCKHIRAVRITLKRELGMDGSITETKEITFTEKRVYAQAWDQYNLAQATEKKRFQVLLQDLCRNLPDPEHNKPGPKPHRVCDSIFSMVYKVYCGFSARRFSSDLADAHTDGHLTRPVPGIKVWSFHENPNYTPILIDLIEKSAAPLRVVEHDFAVDSTGFSTSKFERWYDQKYGVTKRKCVWVKVHAACGVRTNCVTAVRILDKDAADSPQFKPLVQTTARRFTVNEVSADKAYASNENFEAVHDVGGLFEKMFRYFQCRQQDFLDHYHKRSNVESTFSAVKRKFGDSVRSTNDVAMVNEVLCKLLAHNICCLIMEQCVLGIEPVFWPEEKEPEAKPAPLAIAVPVKQASLF